MLSATGKPFIVTGTYTVTDQQIERLNSRRIRLGVKLDPSQVEDFIRRVEDLKDRLGERGNLVAFPTTAKVLDEAKRALYVGLVKEGWGHNEICGDRRRQGLFGADLNRTLSE